MAHEPVINGEGGNNRSTQILMQEASAQQAVPTPKPAPPPPETVSRDDAKDSSATDVHVMQNINASPPPGDPEKGGANDGKDSHQ